MAMNGAKDTITETGDGQGEQTPTQHQQGNVKFV